MAFSVPVLGQAAAMNSHGGVLLMRWPFLAHAYYVAGDVDNSG
jgi:hypothetical protein